MPDTVAKRTEQLKSIVNELTARIAGDPGNTDLPPLLASAQAELDTLGTAGASASGASGTAFPAAVVRPKLVVSPPAKPVTPTIIKPVAKPAVTPAVSKRPETGLGKTAVTRPAPARPRAAPTNPALTAAPRK